jgi:hypothetical protein
MLVRILTRAYNQNSTHPAVAEYLPEVKAEYLNMCKSTYQVVPVAVFIMMLCNACFMFQTDKTDNMLIKALERFDMTPNVDDNTFFKTMRSTSQNIHCMIILPTNTLQLIILLLNNKQFIQFKQLDCVSWLHLNASCVLGNKIAKPISKHSFAD